MADAPGEPTDPVETSDADTADGPGDGDPSGAAGGPPVEMPEPERAPDPPEHRYDPASETTGQAHARRRKRKSSAALFSVAVALTLCLLKLGTGLWTQSIAVLAMAADSLLDLMASSINFFAVRTAEEPADFDHPFGHGKAEHLASLMQAVIITATGVWVGVEAMKRLIHGVAVDHPLEAMAVMVVSVVASAAVAWWLAKVAKETDSPALRADSEHFRVDVVSNGAVLVALVVVALTSTEVGMTVDAATGLIASLFIVWTGIDVGRGSVDDLMDKALSEDMRGSIDDVITAHYPDVLAYHQLRTRRSGSRKMVDLHLVICRRTSFTEVHEICEDVEGAIVGSVGNCDVITHADPCAEACERVGCERDNPHGERAEERRRLRGVMEKVEWRLEDAAAALRLSPRALKRRLQGLGIADED